MAFGKRIIQEIELHGEQVKREFRDIDKEGSAAFRNIAKSGEATTANLAAIEAAAKRAGVTVKQFQKNMGASGAGRLALDIADIKANMSGLNDASDQAGQSLNATNNSAVRLGQTFRLLGRAAGIRSVSMLGRDVSILGRAFAVAAPFLFVAGLAAVASSAATAASNTADLAAENKTSTTQFQELVSAEVAVGRGSEEAGKGFKGLSDLIKETASNAKQNESTLKNLSGQLQETKDKAFELGRGFADIARTSQKSFDDIRRSQIEASISFNQSIARIHQERRDILSGQPISAEEQTRRKLMALDQEEANLVRKFTEEKRKAAEDLTEAERKQKEEKRKLNLELDAQAKKEKEIKAELAAAAVEAENNKTALDKLGISATTGNGKLKKTPEVLLEIANALKGVTDAEQLAAVQNDLVAAGLDRRLLPSLRLGADAYKQLVAEGDKIRPPFTPEQIVAADKFGIATGQIVQAVGALKDAIGLAIAPTFTAFFTSLTAAIVGARPAIVEFLSIIGNVLKPVFEGLGIIINSVIIPAFQGFGQILASVNQLLGTNVTGPQLFAAAIVAVAGALLPIPTIILGVVAAFSQFKATLQENPILLGLLISAITFLVLAFGGIPLAIAAVILAVGLVIAKWDDIKAAGSAVAASLQQSWENFKTWFAGTWAGAIIKTISDIIGWFNKLGQARDSSGGGVNNSDAAVGFAGGGAIRGPGTPTSDSIPIWASTGEHMIQAKAARYYGRAFMNAINHMRYPRSLIRGFANGGAITMGRMPTMSPLKLAKGGPIPRAMRPLSVTFPGIGTFADLLAPEDVADRMIKVGTRKQITSGGRKPSSYGGR